MCARRLYSRSSETRTIRGKLKHALPLPPRASGNDRALEGYGTGADFSSGDVQRKLGIGPGSVLEWEEDGNKMIVRRAGRFSSSDIHGALFGVRKLERHSLNALKDGIRRYVRKRYARG
jgi:hypothetical protein